MSQLKRNVLEVLKGISLPGGGNLESLDMIRALTISNGEVSFVIEVDASKVKNFEAVTNLARKEIFFRARVTNPSRKKCFFREGSVLTSNTMKHRELILLAQSDPPH